WNCPAQDLGHCPRQGRAFVARLSRRSVLEGEARRRPAARGLGSNARAGRQSMTSLERRKRSGGIVIFRARAVLRLITSSNLLARSIGKSAGFAPFRILSMYDAER